MFGRSDALTLFTTCLFVLVQLLEISAGFALVGVPAHVFGSATCKRSMAESNARDGNGLRGPLARCKALHARLDCGIDEIFLDYAGWIRLADNEREHGVHSLQNLRQLLWVFVVCLHPRYPLGSLASRSILNSSISLHDTVSDGCEDDVPTFLDNSKISCF